VATSGRAVVFAGSTVVLSLLGLFLLGLSFIYGAALGAIIAVLLVMTASVTLLPAALGFAGRAIDRLHAGPRTRAGQAPEAGQGFWWRWSHGADHFPAPGPGRRLRHRPVGAGAGGRVQIDRDSGGQCPADAAVDGRRLWRDGRGVPVGLARHGDRQRHDCS